MSTVLLICSLISLVIALVILIKFFMLCKDVHYIAEVLYLKAKENRDSSDDDSEIPTPSKKISSHGYFDVIFIVIIVLIIAIAVLS